jgi:flavin-dependent thymidylate synthase
MSNELSRWADSAMYRSESMPEGVSGPAVTLLNATPDPLGSVAALCAAYKGRVIRSLTEVTDDERRQAFEDMTKTVLNGPLESVQFHFLIENVSRALVDQLTRGRAAFYAVESLRFAVKENWADEVPRPPSIPGIWDARREGDNGELWESALSAVESAYQSLVEKGVPAEDARRLLPIGIATRAHWVVDLRELLSVAGKRLCTQAEFEWRALFGQVVLALRGYWSNPGLENLDDSEASFAGVTQRQYDGWQFEYIADQMRPVCYQQGKCGFMAQFDRGCTIRERVEANAKVGRPSSEWHLPLHGMVSHEGVDGFVGKERGVIVEAIKPEEWLADPTAARRRA